MPEGLLTNHKKLSLVRESVYSLWEIVCWLKRAYFGISVVIKTLCWFCSGYNTRNMLLIADQNETLVHAKKC